MSFRSAGLALALFCTASCSPHLPTLTAAEHRAEGRRLAHAGERGAAHRSYVIAVSGGEEDARIEDGLLRVGAQPEWVDGLAPEVRVSLREELAVVDRTSADARILYGMFAGLLAGTAVSMANAAIARIPDRCVAWLGPCADPPLDETESHVWLAVGTGLGVSGLVLLGAGIGFDVDSGARRGAWRERVEGLHLEVSAGADHARLVIAGPLWD